MLNEIAVRTGRLASESHHLRPPAAVAAVAAAAAAGRDRANQIRDAAPVVLGSLARRLPHPNLPHPTLPHLGLPHPTLPHPALPHLGLSRPALPHPGLPHLPHPAASYCEACELEATPSRVTIHEWDSGRWFVTDDVFGMLGEIEFIGTHYQVFHTSDAKGAVFVFRSLSLAVEYFDVYAAALTL